VAQKSSDPAGKPLGRELRPVVTIEPRVFAPSKRQRRGRGFSREEIKKAGLTPQQALAHGVIVDYKRKTGHEENVEALKALLGSKTAATRAKPKRKAAASIKPRVKTAVRTKPKRKTKS
jgi:ribosomal protein L13E